MLLSPAERRERFWTAYVRADPATAGERGAGPNGATNRWRPIVGARLVISRYLNNAGVGLFLRGEAGMNGEAWVRLKAASPWLSIALDAPLGDKTFAYQKARQTTVEDDDDLHAAVAWLIAETAHYEEVAKTRLVV